MTPDQLKALRELASRATPGEWAQCTAPDTNNKQAVCDHFFEFIARTDVYSIHSDDTCEANAAFIAAACPATVIALLDEIERLRKSDEWNAAHAKMMARAADTEKSEAKAWREMYQSAEQQLALMTRARDEACDIAARLGTIRTNDIGRDYQQDHLRRISQLRLIGSKESHE